MEGQEEEEENEEEEEKEEEEEEQEEQEEHGADLSPAPGPVYRAPGRLSPSVTD